MEQILVVLKERDRMQDIIPILQKIAKPGMKVTFLLSYPGDVGAWLRDHWIVTESTRKAMLEGKRIIAKYSWEEQKQLAEQKISLARETLGKLGIDVSWVIKGCWRRAAREYAVNEDLQFILMSVGRGEAIMGFVHAGTLLLRRIKQSSFSSFLLCRPRARAHYRESTAPIT